MDDLIIVAVLAAIVAVAARYVYKAKKSGRKCIGCPDGGSCGCGCGGEKETACNCGCGGTSAE